MGLVQGEAALLDQQGHGLANRCRADLTVCRQTWKVFAAAVRRYSELRPSQRFFRREPTDGGNIMSVLIGLVLLATAYTPQSLANRYREAKRKYDASYKNACFKHARAEEAADQLCASATSAEAVRCEENLMEAEAALRRAQWQQQALASRIARLERPVALAVDLETCGNPPCIWQIAVVVANSELQPTPSFEALVLPPSSALHTCPELPQSIDLSAARPFALVWRDLEAWLNQNVQADFRRVVWAAHNGKCFDFPILERHLAANGLAWRKNWRQFDTLVLAKELLSPPAYHGRHKLGNLYALATCGDVIENAHDALADAAALVLVWRYLAERSECSELAAAPSHTRPPSVGGTSFVALQRSLSRHGMAGWELEGREPPRLLQLTRGQRHQQHEEWQQADGTRYSYTNERLVPVEPVREPDLRRLCGVGPMTEHALNAEGIRTVAELQRWLEREAGDADAAGFEDLLSRTLWARGVQLPLEKVRSVVGAITARRLVCRFE